MTAAEIAFAFLKRGIDAGLGLSQFAALAYLAAHGESDRAAVMFALRLTSGTNTAHALLGKLHDKGLITQRLSHKGSTGKYFYKITREGMRTLGLRDQRREASTPC